MAPGMTAPACRVAMSGEGTSGHWEENAQADPEQLVLPASRGAPAVQEDLPGLPPWRARSSCGKSPLPGGC